jgi:hypothetical protein
MAVERDCAPDWQIATQPTFTYNATSVLLGVRAQR